MSNIWWRDGDMLFTPALSTGVLAGVTRGTILELAPDAGYRVSEGTFTVDELRGADEAFTSSAVREIMPVIAVDGRDRSTARRGGGQAAGAPRAGRAGSAPRATL